MKHLFTRGAQRITRPRIRERYIVEVLLPVSCMVLTDDCGTDYERALQSYNDWTTEHRDRTTPPPIVWLDIRKTR